MPTSSPGIGLSTPPACPGTYERHPATGAPLHLLPTLLTLAATVLVATLALVMALAPTAAAARRAGTPGPGRWQAVSRAEEDADSLRTPGADGGRMQAKSAMLDPGQNGTSAPTGNATAKPQPRPLLAPAYHRYVRTGSAAVALTFDDGPDSRWTPKILAELRKRHIKGTFCVIGSSARAHPDLIRQIVAEGHALCNHSLTHNLKLGKRSRAAIRADLRASSAAITKASGGVAPKYFRAPGGNWTPTIISVASQLGMASLHWAADPRDWARPPTATIVARVRAAVRPGAIVLMHDGGGDRSRSLAALRILLPGLTSKYRLIRL